MKTFFRLTTLGLSLFSAGCATTTSYVAPTEDEARAARNFKKTVAIAAIDDQGSLIPGLQLQAASAFEYWLDGRFNLVERRKAVAFISAPRFLSLSRNDQAVEAGKGLGADLALFVHVKASPYLGDVSQTAGTVSVQQPSVKSDISYELFDTKTGQALVAGSSYGTSWRDVEIPLSLQGGAMDINRVIHLINGLSEYRGTYGVIVEEAVWSAASEAATNIASYFPMDGEVLEIKSDTEVVINIGSAYGIQPGANLTLWKSAGQMTDPRTGLLVSPKENKATLEVVHVTGGLTCVARTGKKALAGTKVGDKVSFY